MFYLEQEILKLVKYVTGESGTIYTVERFDQTIETCSELIIRRSTNVSHLFPDFFVEESRKSEEQVLVVSDSSIVAIFRDCNL